MYGRRRSISRRTYGRGRRRIVGRRRRSVRPLRIGYRF